MEKEEGKELEGWNGNREWKGEGKEGRGKKREGKRKGGEGKGEGKGKERKEEFIPQC